MGGPGVEGGNLRRRSAKDSGEAVESVDDKSDKKTTIVPRGKGKEDNNRRLGQTRHRGDLPRSQIKLDDPRLLLLMLLLSLPAFWVLSALASRFVAGFGLNLPLPLSPRQQVGICQASTFSAVLPSYAVVENITSVPENGTFGEGAANVASPTDPTGLPALCAAIINVTSSSTSSYRFGLFLPQIGKWNSRFLAVGNGGFSGGIQWLGMAPGPHYGFATISTDTGHNSTSTNLTWALNNPESRTDWGWRAMHGSVKLGKLLAETYYGAKIQYSYYQGCSTGGRQGLKEIQISPESFDGVLIGAPAWYTSHLNTYATKAGLFNLPIEAEHHVNATFFPTLADEVVRQCDKLDGVEDGIVSATSRCNISDPSVFTFANITCGLPGVNASACLTPPQIQTVLSIYGDWRSSATGKLLYPAVSPSAEDQWYILYNGTEPSAFGVGYAKYFIFGDPDWDWRTFNDSVVELAERLDPGDATADAYNVHPFRSRGGKILLYHGTADGLVPLGGSELYYNRTREAMFGGSSNATNPNGTCPSFSSSSSSSPSTTDGSETEEEDDAEQQLRSFFRYFPIPGMQHCAGSAVSAPWHVGAPAQPPVLGSDSWSVPGFVDAEHDALLALMGWVENRTAVERIVATAWREANNSDSGVLRQRPLCPWPAVARWDGVGDVDLPGSWECM